MGGLWRQIQPYVLLGAQSGGDPSQTTPFLAIEGVLIASWFGETPFPGSSSLRCYKGQARPSRTEGSQTSARHGGLHAIRPPARTASSLSARQLKLWS